MPPRLGAMPGDELHRDRERVEAEPWRRWYRTARWTRLRLAIFARDLFACQWPGCRFVSGEPGKLVCDHVKPHRGDILLFWDEANLQTLCKPCHDRHKQSVERGGRAGHRV